MKQIHRMRPRLVQPEPEPTWSKLTWAALAIACIVFVAAVIGRAEDNIQLTPSEFESVAGDTITVSVQLETSREVQAVRASLFYDYESTGLMFGGAERGAGCPPSWSFAYWNNLDSFPSTLILDTVGNGISGSITGKVEVFRIRFIVTDCGYSSNITMPADPILNALTALPLFTVAVSCESFTCCCWPTLVLSGATVKSHCPVDVAPAPSWAHVKALYQ